MLLDGLPAAFIGLALTFASVALLATTVTNTLTSITSWRSRTLAAGLADLLHVRVGAAGWLSAGRRALGIVRGSAAPAYAALAPGDAAWNRVRDAEALSIAAAGTPSAEAARNALKAAHDAAIEGGQGNLLVGLWRSAGVSPLARGPNAAAALTGKARPDYIAAKDFAGALLDVIHFASNPSTAAPDIEASLNKVPDAQLREFLVGAWYRASGRPETQIEQWQADIAEWFDNAMARVSEIYQRDVRLIAFLVGLMVAVLGNVDAVDISRGLVVNSGALADVQPPATSRDPRLLMGWAQALREADDDAWQTARKTDPRAPRQTSTLADHALDAWFWLRRLPGFLITAIAAMFGAPFWFDATKSVARLRGGGEA